MQAVVVTLTAVCILASVIFGFMAAEANPNKRGWFRNNLLLIAIHKDEPEWRSAWTFLRRAVVGLVLAMVLTVINLTVWPP